jgi:hypothetical protein
LGAAFKLRAISDLSEQAALLGQTISRDGRSHVISE